MVAGETSAKEGAEICAGLSPAHAHRGKSFRPPNTSVRSRSAAVLMDWRASMRAAGHAGASSQPSRRAAPTTPSTPP
eukprot:7389078-Prymnesium_polylepis.1